MTKEEIIEKYEQWKFDVTDTDPDPHNGFPFLLPSNVLKAMEEYATQQLAAKDKELQEAREEIERLKGLLGRAHLWGWIDAIGKEGEPRRCYLDSFSELMIEIKTQIHL